MKTKIFKLIFVLGVFSVLSAYSFADADLIIKYKPTHEEAQAIAAKHMTTSQVRTNQMKPYSATRVSALSKAAGATVEDVRPLATGAHVICVKKSLSTQELEKVINQIKQSDPNIKYIVPDRRVKAFGSDAFNTLRQWDMQLISTVSPSWFGDNFIGVQNIFQNLPAPLKNSPGNGVVVAVVDTGYTPHPNFLSNLVALPGSPGEYGYQFISDCRTAGTCPVSTPSSSASIPPSANGLDRGDFVTQSEINSSGGFFAQDCKQDTSSWHGSHVTGTVIAQGFESGSVSAQILGGAYGAKVLPVRVLGKCGGSNSDVIEGLLWAVGRTVPGVPQNQNKAQVINMSLGSDGGGCDAATQDAIDQANESGAIVVVAAGNATQNITQSSPAGCKGVVTVASRGPTGKLAFYSNFGATTITASGGDSTVSVPSITPAPTPALEAQIYSTIWGSAQKFASSDGPAFGYLQGTSQATPHVSAALADMVSYLKANDISYTSADLIQALINTEIFPTNAQDQCNSGGCVDSGMLNAESAVSYIVAGNLGTLLTANPDTINFTKVNSPETVTVTNNNNDDVKIDTLNFPELVSQQQFAISPQSTCKDNTILSKGSSCTIVISATSRAINGKSAILEIRGGNGGVVIASITLNYNEATSSGGGGGCSAIKNGDDYGLIILLLIGVVLYAFRRKKINT